MEAYGIMEPLIHCRGPFLPGSVFTIEPGIYIPEENLGVCIEDVVYVAADGKLIGFQQSLPPHRRGNRIRHGFYPPVEP